MELDALSAFFILAILLLSALSAIYGIGYMKKYGQEKNIGFAGFYYNLLVLSMVLVCLARDSMLFIISWEIMALSSFFLVAFENEKVGTRKAAWIYLIASQLSTAFLITLFLILNKVSGSSTIGKDVLTLSPTSVNICFFLAIIGFGTKAGIMPLHVWLPEAHPAAPSHVSAVLSGVMIKTGIYGLLRILPMLGPPPINFGMTLVFLGSVSCIFGVLFALAQHDLKRLLAYSSVENVGIILLGMGIGFIGLSIGLPSLSALGFAGGLLHVINHALFKGLLFMGAGAVLKETHTREMDHLGGLIKKMPFTGLFFLIASISITGLPPFNGFVSEFFIFITSFQGTFSLSGFTAVSLVIVIGSLALTGGLATACFTKAFGIVFLGEPRMHNGVEVGETNRFMLVPMAILSFLCIGIGVCSPWIIGILTHVVKSLSGSAAFEELNIMSGKLSSITTCFAVLIILIVIVAGIRKYLLARNKAFVSGQIVPTWDCGYAAPSSSMQYSSSSFAQPITDLFKVFLRTKKSISRKENYFPGKERLATETPDLSRESMFGPVFRGIQNTLFRFRVLQEGRLQIYVLYIVLTLLVLLIWKLR